ncbi:MAG: NUDIX domain-containing protein [Candidatus Thorarchaeota archaeon]
MNVEKVTAFITRKKRNEELLLIQHPNAGIQIPAGTVEKGETVEEALKREIIEETGLKKTRIKRYLGFKEKKLSSKEFIISDKTKVYSRPTATSFDWFELRKGCTVTQNRICGEYTQITYKEYDRFPKPSYVTYQITGWVPSALLSREIKRHFFHVTTDKEIQDEWEIFADNHKFKLFWSPFGNLANIIESQFKWLNYVQYELRYKFESD